jgi:hypothetical protein
MKYPEKPDTFPSVSALYGSEISRKRQYVPNSDSFNSAQWHHGRPVSTISSTGRIATRSPPPNPKAANPIATTWTNAPRRPTLCSSAKCVCLLGKDVSHTLRIAVAQRRLCAYHNHCRCLLWLVELEASALERRKRFSRILQ